MLSSNFENDQQAKPVKFDSEREIVSEIIKKIKKKPGLPQSYTEILFTCPLASIQWETKPKKYHLIYTDPVTFREEWTEMNNIVHNYKKIVAGMHPNTNTIKVTEQKILKGVGAIKGLLKSVSDSQTEAISNYENFGIYRNKNKYEMPTSQTGRIKSLNLMIEAVVSFGFVH